MSPKAHSAEMLSEPARSPRTGLDPGAHRSHEGVNGVKRSGGAGPATDELMRLFVAIAPPAAVLDELDALVEPLRSSRQDLRWTGWPGHGTGDGPGLNRCAASEQAR